jgi:GntP family gluconate:H+ symporter
MESLGQSNRLSEFILWGSIISILAVFFLFIISRLRFKAEKLHRTTKNAHPAFSHEADALNLPRLHQGLFPLIFPLVLIALGSLTDVYGLSKPWIRAISDPAMALFLACLAALGFNIRILHDIPRIGSEAINKVAPVILLTGAGGSFGAVVAETGFIDQLDIQNSEDSIILVLFAFGVASLIKSLQGSSTGAIVVTSSLMAPIISHFELSTSGNLALFAAIGGGAMAVSHVNDSYFWVIAKFEEYSVRDAMKRWTLTTALLAMFTLLFACLLASFGL